MKTLVRIATIVIFVSTVCACTAPVQTPTPEAVSPGEQLEPVEGERLLEEAYALQDSLDVQAAVAKYEEAVTADADLLKRPGVSAFITDTLRIAVTQLVHEGEGLAADKDYEGAHAKFTEALALNTMFDDYAVPPYVSLYVWIEGDEFVMGPGDDDKLAHDGELSHTVSLDGYWIMRTEVTNAQYARCVDKGPCDDVEVLAKNPAYGNPALANRPITYVSWDDAMTYADWVGGTLPTEAQWEMACRGTDGRIYPWSNDAPSPDLLNYAASNLNGTTDVGSYPPGANDLYDMAGNVYEWTADWFDPEYYANAPESNPQGPESGSEYGNNRTLRGGAWRYWVGVGYNDELRCVFRNFSVPDSRSDRIGFRVVSPGIGGR